jgi:hypothetical protein
MTKKQCRQTFAPLCNDSPHREATLRSHGCLRVTKTFRMTQDSLHTNPVEDYETPSRAGGNEISSSDSQGRGITLPDLT